jgi:hypothetical protein
MSQPKDDKGKVISLQLSRHETQFIEEMRGEKLLSDFWREIFLSSPLVQNYAQRTGYNINFIFGKKKRGGKRKGAGNPNWKKKKKD